MGTKLTLREELYTWLDLAPLSPFAGEGADDAAALAAVPLPYGRGAVRADALFALAETDAPGLTLCGELSLAASVGEGMTEGVIRVNGSVGPNAGRSMTGGTLEIAGDAGENAFCTMQNGLGIVFGTAKNGACARMRRGAVVLGCACGALGEGMRGGTLVVKRLLPDAETCIGKNMDRGTIVLPAGVYALPGFAAAAETSLPFLRFLFRELSAHGAPVCETDGDGAFLRLRGDSAALGKGEVFLPAPADAGRGA